MGGKILVFFLLIFSGVVIAQEAPFSRGDNLTNWFQASNVRQIQFTKYTKKDLKRVTLEPNETKTVSLSITPEKLAFYDINMNFTVEPGKFVIMRGNSSRDEDLT